MEEKINLETEKWYSKQPHLPTGHKVGGRLSALTNRLLCQ